MREAKIVLVAIMLVSLAESLWLYNEEVPMKGIMFFIGVAAVAFGLWVVLTIIQRRKR